MSKIKKSLVLAAFTLVAAASLLCFKPVRVWASAEGDYIYHQLILRGPQYVFKSTVGGVQGIVISTTAYTGSNSSVVPSTSGINIQILGGESSAARTTCAGSIEGQLIYDSTIHSLAFCDGTNWHKLVTGSGANDNWTSY